MIAVTIFSEGSGIINKALTSLGAAPIAWQSDGTAAFVSVMVTAIWLRIGFNMVIYLAGLQSVSPELYEAARLDGRAAVAAVPQHHRAARGTVDVLPADHERHRVVPVCSTSCSS